MFWLSFSSCVSLLIYAIQFHSPFLLFHKAWVIVYHINMTLKFNNPKISLFPKYLPLFFSFIFYPHLLLTPNMSYRNPGFGNVFAKKNPSVWTRNCLLYPCHYRLERLTNNQTMTKNCPSQVTFDSDEPEMGACKVVDRQQYAGRWQLPSFLFSSLLIGSSTLASSSFLFSSFRWFYSEPARSMLAACRRRGQRAVVYKIATWFLSLSCIALHSF